MKKLLEAIEQRSSLRVKATLLTACVLTGLVVVVGFKVLRTVSAETQRSHEQRLDMAIAWLSYRCESTLAGLERADPIPQVLGEFGPELQAIGVSFCALVQRPPGRTFTHGDAPEQFLSIASSGDFRELEAHAVLRGDSLEIHPLDPKGPGGQSAAWLVLGRNQSALGEELAGVRWLLFGLMAGAALISAFLAGVVAKEVVRPLHSFRDFTRRFAAGERPRMTVRPRSELRLLGESLDRMAEAVVTARNKVNWHNERLELIVELRTEKLSQAVNGLRDLDHLRDELLHSLAEHLEPVSEEIGEKVATLQGDRHSPLAKRTLDELHTKSNTMEHLVTEAFRKGQRRGDATREFDLLAPGQP